MGDSTKGSDAVLSTDEQATSPVLYTRIYPIRSLLSDVKRSSKEDSNPGESLDDSLESERSMQRRRTAQWAINTSPALRIPSGSDRSTASPTPSAESGGVISPAAALPTGNGQPFISGFGQTSTFHNQPSGDIEDPSSLYRRSSTSGGNKNARPSVAHENSDGTVTTSPAAEISSNIGRKKTHTTLNAPGNLAGGGYVHLGPSSDLSDRASNSKSSLKMTKSGSTSQDHKFADTATNVSVDAPEAPTSSENATEEFQSSWSNQTVSSTDEFFKTTRFEHTQTEDGHRLLLGYKGGFERCEDEPIHTPGAVQGFGVLIALEEDYETGNLIVRQVSENCTEILGLTPHYLFGLECFSHTLPQTQADILWDNIQYLSDPGPDEGKGEGKVEDAPQVFLLRGYGQPGSHIHTSSTRSSDKDSISSSRNSSQAISTSTANSADRRQWACWCAAHRLPSSQPSNSASAKSSSQSLPSASSGGKHARIPIIILEFELEHDEYNPLYPREDSVYTGDVSPGTSSQRSAPRSSGTPTQDSVTSTGSSDRATARANETSTTPVSQNTARTLSEVQPPAAEHLGLDGEAEWRPSDEAILESTTNKARPIRALERMRRMEKTALQRVKIHSALVQERTPEKSRAGQPRSRRREFGNTSSGTLDVFSVLAQVNEQLSGADNLAAFLEIVVGVVKDLTQFHRVLLYQFDESNSGQVVAELVDWNKTNDLYRGLHFPAGDIPAQARALYKLNKVRSLYDRGQTTARLVGRTKADVENPLDMTHCYLRAMSPIHLKYLENMGVRGSMSVSIVCFGELWGLVCCHSYGNLGMRVSFPVRQMLRLLSDSISRNVEKLSYTQRLHTRKLINTIPTDIHPTGHIVSNAEDLLGLFDADYGALVIGEGAKILGPNDSSQDILIIVEYLRLKQFTNIQVTQDLHREFSDIESSISMIAGMLYIPLSMEGRDFIVFLRKGQLRHITWAGRPQKPDRGLASLEPRASFRAWSETVASGCRAWADEQLETAGVLALVYGKFIEVWRQKETAVKTTQLTNILLSNASHEVRTPLNQIINYLELALNGPLDGETRDNLSMSHIASKNLLFTINDLLDLTRLESGHETLFSEPFDFPAAIHDAVGVYRTEAQRRRIDFVVNTSDLPNMVIGDSKKIQTVISNLTANAVKYTDEGTVSVEARLFPEPQGLRNPSQIVVEIIVGDTGCGIESSKLESMFREFEQVEASSTDNPSPPGLGLGLAVVARIVEQMGGQLRVDSKPGEGSRFSFLTPFTLPQTVMTTMLSNDVISPALVSRKNSLSSGRASTGQGSKASELDGLIDAISTSSAAGAHISHGVIGSKNSRTSQSSAKAHARSKPRGQRPVNPGEVELVDSHIPIRAVKLDPVELDSRSSRGSLNSLDQKEAQKLPARIGTEVPQRSLSPKKTQLRVLIVEDDVVNRNVLAKRLKIDGHTVVTSTNGQEGVDVIARDREFDCILMDIQMPILDGFGATEKIRAIETANPLPLHAIRPSIDMNGGIPIFAVSASLRESQRQFMIDKGMNAWILKPIDFKRLAVLLKGTTDLEQRQLDHYYPGCNWEKGGWMRDPIGT